MSEQLKFYKGLQEDLPKSDIEVGALYHCTDTGNTYRGISETELELFSSAVGKATLDNGEIFNNYENNDADKDCHAEGSGTKATRGYAHAEGFGTEAYWRSHAQGFYSHARADSMAGGRMSYSAGPGSLAFGIEWNEQFSTTSADIQLQTGTLIKSTGLFNDSHVGRFVCLQGVGLNSDGTEINILTDARKIVSVTGGEATIDRPFYEPLQPTYSDIQQDGFIIKKGAEIKLASPCEATGVASVAFGCATKAKGNRSFTSGHKTQAIGDFSHAEGEETIAEGKSSHAEGWKTHAHNHYSHVEGYNTYTDGVYSHAEGNQSHAIGEGSHAEGYSVANGNYSHTEGYETSTTHNYGHAEGRKTEAFYCAHAEGNEAYARGSSSHAEGGSIAINYNKVNQQLIASGNYAHAEGKGSTASGEAAHAEGLGSLAKGKGSHAEGQATYASEESAHAEGCPELNTDKTINTPTQAKGRGSHAEGMGNIAESWGSHAEGRLTIAKGAAAHSEGFKTQAIGSYAHAEGGDSIAEAEGSHVEGKGTVAKGVYQHVQGKYNEIDTTGQYAHIIGGGSSSNKKNIHTVDWSGNAWYAGEVHGTNISSKPFKLNNVVCIGDSFAKSYPDKPGREAGWYQRLKTLAQKDNPNAIFWECFEGGYGFELEDYPFTNLIGRLVEKMNDTQKKAVETVIIIGGINDVTFAIKEGFNPSPNPHNTIIAAQDAFPNATIVVGFSPIVNKIFYDSEAKKNYPIPSSCDQYFNDFFSANAYWLNSSKDWLLTKEDIYDWGDKLHPNSKGLSVISENIYKISNNQTIKHNNMTLLDSPLALQEGISYGTQSDFENIQNDAKIPDGSLFIVVEI